MEPLECSQCQSQGIDSLAMELADQNATAIIDGALADPLAQDLAVCTGSAPGSDVTCRILPCAKTIQVLGVETSRPHTRITYQTDCWLTLIRPRRSGMQLKNIENETRKKETVTIQNLRLCLETFTYLQVVSRILSTV